MWPHVVSRILRRSGGAPGGHLHLAAKWTWLGVPWGSVRWSPISTRWVLGSVTHLPTLWQQEFVYLEWHIFQVWPEDIVLHALNWLTDSSALAESASVFHQCDLFPCVLSQVWVTQLWCKCRWSWTLLWLCVCTLFQQKGCSNSVSSFHHLVKLQCFRLNTSWELSTKSSLKAKKFSL